MAWTRPGPGRPPKHAAVTRLQDIISREEARDFAREIVDNPEYRQTLLNRALKGQLHPNIEALLLFYRFGKPGDQVQESPSIDVTPESRVELSKLSDEQLALRAEQLAKMARQIKDTEGENSEPLEGEVVRSESLTLIKR